MDATKAKSVKLPRKARRAKRAQAQPVDLTSVDGIRIARAAVKDNAKAFASSRASALAILKREGLLTQSGRVSRRYA
jgi:hypothetical protein